MKLRIHEDAQPGVLGGQTPQTQQPQQREAEIDPREYAALVNYYQQTIDFTEPLLQNERARTIAKRYAEDEDFRGLIDEAERIETASRQRKQEEIPSWARELRDEVNQTRSMVNEKIIKPNEERTERERRAYEEQQGAAARELMAKHDIDLPMLRAIAAYGDQMGIRDINDAYKHFSGAMNKEKPPASIRASVSTPGVPGPSGNPTGPPKDKNDLVRRLSNNLKSVRSN